MPLWTYSRIWDFTLSSSRIAAKDALGSEAPAGIDRNEPPWLIAGPGWAHTRHFPFVWGASTMRSARCQEAPKSAGKRPSLTAAAASEVSDWIVAMMPALSALTVMSHALRMWSWSPMKVFFSSMNPLPDCGQIVPNKPAALRTR